MPAFLEQATWQTATLLSVRQETPQIKVFAFRLEKPIGFLPGQHADIRLTAPDGYQAIRSYSITDIREGGAELELAIERLADGEVSSFFHDVAAPDDTIELRGALGGHFIWPAGSTAPVLLIGAGSGVAPFVAMLRYHGRSGEFAPTVLLLSSRTYDDIPFREELISIAEQRAGLSVRFVLTREQPRRSMDFAGRIDSLSIGAILGSQPDQFGAVFICGSNDFVNAAADLLVVAQVSAAIIKTERYGG